MELKTIRSKVKYLVDSHPDIIDRSDGKINYYLAYRLFEEYYGAAVYYIQSINRSLRKYREDILGANVYRKKQQETYIEVFVKNGI